MHGRDGRRHRSGDWLSRRRRIPRRRRCRLKNCTHNIRSEQRCFDVIQCFVRERCRRLHRELLRRREGAQNGFKRSERILRRRLVDWRIGWHRETERGGCLAEQMQQLVQLRAVRVLQHERHQAALKIFVGSPRGRIVDGRFTGHRRRPSSNQKMHAARPWMNSVSIAPRGGANRTAVQAVYTIHPPFD